MSVFNWFVKFFMASGEGSFEPSQRCNYPPAGWYCTRERGHEGPCAAVPYPPVDGDVTDDEVDKMCAG